MRHAFEPQGKCNNGAHVMASKSPFGLTVWGWGSPEAGECAFNASTCYVSYGYPAGVVMYDTATSQWNDLGGGFSGSTAANPAPNAVLAKTLTVVAGGEVVAGGAFSIASGRNAFGIARWDGNSWNPVDAAGARRFGVNGQTMAGAVGPDGSFYAGGTFGLVGGDVAVNNIARFKDGAWHPLADGIGGAVWTLAFNATGTELYAGGAFGSSGGVVASNVAKWNGAAWSALGAGLDRPVSILKVGPDGKVYAGGDFTKSGSVTVNRIAVWDGQAWSPLGEGFADGRVASIAFGPDGKLYAGGTFKKSGAANLRSIAVWDGDTNTWSAVGGGVEGPSAFATQGVYDITFYEGKLTSSGQFTKQSVLPDGGVTSPLNNVAVLDGTMWQAVGTTGLPSRSATFNNVQARRMVVRGKDLYVAGVLELLESKGADGGAPRAVKHVAKWDGTTWTEVGGGVSDAVDEIVSTDDSFWAVGAFTWPEGAGPTGSHGTGTVSDGPPARDGGSSAPVRAGRSLLLDYFGALGVSVSGCTHADRSNRRNSSASPAGVMRPAHCGGFAVVSSLP